MRRYRINKDKKAAAVAFTPGDPAPLLLAAGAGREAGLILEAARKAGITIMEDAGLASLLQAVKPGDYIPFWCWDAVAKILAFVFAQENEFWEQAG
jgi:flagellar biosynthesis protein